MADDLKRLSDLAHSGEELLKHLLHAREDAEIDTLIERVKRWGEELIARAEAYDPITLRFSIMRPTSEETARIWQFYPELRDDQRAECNYVEAALGHLNRYLRQHAALPKGKGGNRRKYNDGPILEAALAILESSGTKSKSAAVREAIKHSPELAPGAGTEESTIKRITRKM